MDTQAPAPPADEVILWTGWWRALESWLAVGGLTALGVLAIVAIATSGPMDYRFTAVIVGAATGTALSVRLPIVAARAAARTTLRPRGIGPTLPWSEIDGLRVRWLPLGGYLFVHGPAARSAWLRGPTGAWWRPDRAFRRDVERVREYAVAHGARIESVQYGHPIAIRVAAAVVLVGLLAVSGVQAARRGVFWPWQAGASYPADPCAALDPGTLDQVWPPQSRTTRPAYATEDGSEKRSSCGYRPAGDQLADTAHSAIEVSFVQRRGDVFESPVASAHGLFAGDRDGAANSADLSGVGAEAFVGHNGRVSTAEARVADMIVRVEVRRRDDSPAGGVAEQLLRGAVARLEVH